MEETAKRKRLAFISGLLIGGLLTWMFIGEPAEVPKEGDLITSPETL